MTTARTPHRSRRRLAAALATVLGATAVSALALVAPTPAPVGAAQGVGTGTAGQTLTVSDVDDLSPGGTTVTVTGAGFDADAGFDVATEGLYLSVCVDNGAGQLPTPCLGGMDQTGGSAVSRLITNDPPDGVPPDAVIPINASGQFTTTLLVTAQDEFTDCFDLPVGKSCKIVTRVDHRGTGDRSQDVKVAIDFADRRTTTQSFVTAAITDFLREKDPSDSQVNAGVAQVQQQGKARYLRSLSTSDAWLESVVDKLYQDTLGRHGDPSGTAYWIGQLRTGRRTVAAAAAEFYASPEYFNGIGGGTVGSWIDDLYVKILQRPSDASGRAYWINQVASTSRGSVAFRFYQSTESARTRVRGLYQVLLGRGTDQAGLNYWAPRVITSGDLTLAVFLADSPEYQNRAVTRFP